MNRMAVLGCIAIVLITSAVYSAGVLRNAFVEWDDGLLIMNNPMVQGLNSDNIKQAFTSYDPELYIPLTFLSYQIDYEIWGLNPVGFHITNLLLHMGNALLVVWFLSRFGWRLAMFGGALFAIHPLHTEAVMWASARKDVLMGFFFLLSLNFYLRSRDSISDRSSDSKIAALRLSNRSYGIITFVLACMAKVTAVMLPFILLLMDWHDEPHPRRGAAETYIISRARSWARNLQEKIPYFLISLLFILIALFGKAGSHGLWWEKVLIGAKATIFYLQKLFWPTGLSVLYPYTDKISIANPDLWVPLILVLLLTILPLSLAISRGEREYKEWVFGWFFFLLLLLPSFTNFAKGQDILKDVYFASDRYAYLASIGVIYVIVLCMTYTLRDAPPCHGGACPPEEEATKWLTSRRTTRLLLCHGSRRPFGAPHHDTNLGLLRVTQYICALVIIFFLSFLSYHQSFVWQTTESLFTNVVQYYPNSHVAQNNLGSLLYRRGEVDRAIEKYKESLAIRPNATAFFNLGVIYMDNGYPEIAREAFMQALKLNPGDQEAKEKLVLLSM